MSNVEVPLFPEGHEMMSHLYWLENHVLPNMVRRKVVSNGKERFWSDVLLEQIESDVSANRPVSLLYVYATDPDTTKESIVSVAYQISNAERIRKMIGAL